MATAFKVCFNDTFEAFRSEINKTKRQHQSDDAYVATATRLVFLVYVKAK